MAGLAAAVALCAETTFGQRIPRRGALPAEAAEVRVSDEQIVASIKRGIDYLLAHKTDAAGDNWESGRNWIQQGQHGGETCLALYALLHAGESLRDDPDYGPKLHYRSKELAPVVTFVERLDANETYTAALQACALALVPPQKGTKPNDGPTDGLKRAQQFLMGAMGAQGGYSYGSLGTTRRGGGFEEAWAKYFEAKSANKDPQAIAQAQARLDQIVRNLQASFGGAEFEIARHSADLRQMQRENPGREMSAAVELELRELQRYEQIMPKTPAIRNPQRNFNPVGDLSNAQFGALGMWALSDAGMDVRVEYWQVTDRFWRLLQKSDGSWPYAAGPQSRDIPSDAMGVAGIASLYIAQEFVDRVLRTTPKPDKNLDMGLAWLNENFRPDSGDYYYMYAVERVGLASGLKYFGTRDWYAEGAANIVNAQNADGSWSEERGNFGRTTPLTSTSFALLFLARGRNPILFNKLQYNGPWNARPRDDAVLTRWTSKRFERPLNWQVVSLDVDATGWMDAPILMITGSRDPKFTDEEIAKLKAFIEAGGMIFSTADDGNKDFTECMKRYAAMVTGNKYPMRELEKAHPLYSRDLGVEATNPPKLLGMSNGVREVWVHSPIDLGASWQLQRFGTKEHFEVPAAMYLYATGKAAMKGKFKDLQVAEPAAVAARKAALARVMYAGNADPEPGAWPRFAKVMRGKEQGIDLAIENVAVANLDASKTPVAHITGTSAFTLKATEVEALRKYLDADGVLLADAAGGSAAFADSFTSLVQSLYPGESLKAVGPDEPAVTGEFAAVKVQRLREIGFRKFGLLALGKNVDEPDLKALTVGGKVKIVFSRYDMTSGLLGTNTWGIVGYTPESSQKLAENLVRWALEGR